MLAEFTDYIFWNLVLQVIVGDTLNIHINIYIIYDAVPEITQHPLLSITEISMRVLPLAACSQLAVITCEHKSAVVFYPSACWSDEARVLDPLLN